MRLSTIAPWLTSVLAIAALITTNSGSISTLLGIAATQTETQIQQDKLQVFARTSAILHAQWNEGEGVVEIVYYISSHPCTDYEVSYVIHNVVVEGVEIPSSVCEDKPELKSGTYAVKRLEIDPSLIRPAYYTIDGQLIESNDVSLLIQWKFALSDGSFGYHTMTVAIPL